MSTLDDRLVALVTAIKAEFTEIDAQLAAIPASPVVTPQQYGAVADGVTDDTAAFIAAIAALTPSDYASYGFAANAKAGATLFVPRGVYVLSSPLDIFATLTIEGESGQAGAGSSVLHWTAACSGFRIQRYNTSGDTTVDSVTHGGGDGTILRNLWLQGNYSGTEAECHAVHAKARPFCENIVARDWAGDGFHIVAAQGSGTANEGNANSWQLTSCVAYNCRNGIYLDGSDTNAGMSLSFNGSLNRQWGIWDSSFLNNRHFGFLLDANGIVSGSTTVCAYSSNLYYCVPGQETWCSTNTPSGTTADNQGWGYLRAGSAGVGATAWASGLTWRAGGPIRTDNGNANHVVEGYIEGSQPPCMFQYPTMALNISGAMKADGSTTDYGAWFGATTSPPGMKTTGTLQVSGSLTCGNGRFELDGQGGIGGQSGPIMYKDSTFGLVIAGWPGSFDNFTITDSGGNHILRSPVGTKDAIIDSGSLGVPERAASAVATPNSGYQMIFIDTADHKLKRKDSSGTVTIIA